LHLLRPNGGDGGRAEAVLLRKFEVYIMQIVICCSAPTM
jgi:hypothetical protein